MKPTIDQLNELSDYEEIPANNRSLSSRKPVYGIGINDSQYLTSHKINGKTNTCPYYKKWMSMFVRCYSGNYPTYDGCSVCDEWIYFSKFKSWMKSQDWTGKELDKDLKIIGNKIYSPEACVFVNSHINSLMLDNKKSRGVYPVGVYLNKFSGKFMAYCAVNRKPKFLGYFKNVSEAAEARTKAKFNEMIRVSKLYPSVERYIAQHAFLLMEDR